MQHSKTKSCDLVAIGSLGEVVAKKKFKRKILKGKDLHVWGTGFLLPGKTYNNRFLNVHALRGELSKNRFRIKANIALGDPGILVSKLYENSNNIYPEGTVLCMPHACDSDSKKWIDKVKEIYQEENVKFISIKRSFIEIIDAIRSSDFIFTTAMHPLIVSNSFEKKVVYISPRNVHPGGNYKLVDYFSVFDLDFKQCGIDFFINEIDKKMKCSIYLITLVSLMIEF